MTNDNLIKKVFYSYLTISIMATLAATIGMLVDGIVVGQFLGQDAVSAFGLAGPMFLLIAAMAGIFSNGGSACASNHVGRGNAEKVRLNFTVTILGAAAVGAVMTCVCVFGDTAVAALLGAEGELIQMTADYIRGIGLGVIPLMLSQVIMIYIRLDNDSNLSFVSVVLMTICNITLDIVLTTVFHMGLFGMGLATSISYTVSVLVCCIHFLKKTNILKFSALKDGLAECKDIVVTGIPSALNRGCMTARGIILNRLLIVLAGSIAVSALAVQNNINQFLSSITMGVGMTTMMMAGIFFGERDKKSLEKTLKVSLKTGILLSAVTSLLVIVFARQAVGMFLKGEGEAIVLSVRSLRLFCLSLPLSLSCVVLLNFYQCTKNLFMANLICIGHGLAFVVLVSLALSPFIGTDGVWISFLCSEILMLLVLVLVIRFKIGRWPKSFSDMMMLSDDFIPAQEKILDISISNDMAQVMELSGRIEEFCVNYTEDSEKVLRLSLCIEEMAGNIVQHGFKDKKGHSIDIRIIIDKDSIIFRMRDDGIAFNPIQYADEIRTGEDQTLGIQMIRKIAKNMEYSNAIGLNNLMIEL